MCWQDVALWVLAAAAAAAAAANVERCMTAAKVAVLVDAEESCHRGAAEGGGSETARRPVPRPASACAQPKEWRGCCAAAPVWQMQCVYVFSSQLVTIRPSGACVQ